MPKRSSKKGAQVPKGATLERQLARALEKRTKAELVEMIMEIARGDSGVLRRLESRFRVGAPPQDLIALTRQAIADATDFDEREINRNFSYDYQAYDAVKSNFGRLIELGQLGEVMEMSLELMGRGSYQVEMSDEGLMTDDVEECLQVVIRALEESDLPPDEVTAWCAGMAKKDRLGFICDTELRTLKERFNASSSK